MRFNVLLAGLLLVVLAVLLWRRPLETHAKAMLFLSEQLPQVPLKPLHLVTSAPAHRTLELDSAHGTIAADLFVPTPRFGGAGRDPRPAVILAMGIKTKPQDRPLLLSVADSLSRLGYVV